MPSRWLFFCEICDNNLKQFKVIYYFGKRNLIKNYLVTKIGSDQVSDIELLI